MNTSEQKFTFRANNSKPNATRIPDERWDDMKETILEMYKDKNMTLAEVKKRMEQEHGFSATTRQYVHHVTEKWKVKKYKQGTHLQPNKRHSSDPKPERPKSKRQRDAAGPGTDDVKRESQPSELLRAQAASTGNRQPERSIMLPPWENSPIAQGEPSDTLGYFNSSASASQPADHVYQTNIDLYDQYFLSAAMLHACGDSLSFSILGNHCQGLASQLPAFFLDVFTRAAQTVDQVKSARVKIDLLVNDALEGYADDSYAVILIDIQGGRTFDWGNDEKNAIGTIEQSILAITDEDLCLRNLQRRCYRLDIPLYLYMSYALRRFNDYVGVDGRGEQGIEIDGFLQQLVRQQLGKNTSVDCLSLCLGWCIDVLQRQPNVPEALCWEEHVNAPTATYQVIGALWTEWLAMAPPAWARDVRGELGISAPEVLVTVASMLMSKAGPGPFHYESVIGKAYTGACALSTAVRDPRKLLDHFLRQLRKNNDQRMLAPRLSAPRVPPRGAEDFRVFVFNSLELPLQPPQPDPIHPVYQLVLSWDEEAGSSSSFHSQYAVAL